MLKLFTLENLPASSEDAVYKICLTLEKYGLTDDMAFTFENYDELFDAVLHALQDGESVIVGADPADYNAVKREMIGKFLLDEYSSPNIAERISQNADDGTAAVDMESECIIPRGALFHLSPDGIKSGFSCAVLNGTLTFLPLDFVRVDAILENYISSVLAPKSESVPEPEAQPEEQESEPQEEQEQGFDIAPSVSAMVSALIQLSKTAAFATGEGAMQVYNLYNKIDGLSDVVNFVEIVDEDEDNTENGELSESESVKTIRHAREAMFNTESDFGAAISDILTSENEDGTTSYFAYIAVAEKKRAKAKKINTTNPNDLELLLPHCVAILCDTLTGKLDDIRRQEEIEKASAEGPQGAKKPEEKKLSKGMIIFIAAVLLVAAITPVILVKIIWSKEDETTTMNPLLTASSSVSGQTQQTGGAFPGIDSNANATTAPGSAGTTAKEPTATEYSAQATAAPAPSTSGKFTFYVFGYGHGVGMSQHGANYLASQGWNYAQILANYYYGTTLVTGDTYPETIKYNGSDYKTREYLASALESEMGSSFQKEALKAQAVALYTFAKYYNYTLGTDSNAFGKTPSQACYDAVDEIMKYGLYIAYNGTEAALTPFHSISAGLTTSFYNVWGKTAVPYLGGGRPSYGDYSVDGFKSTYSVTSDDMKKIIKNKLSVDVSGDPSTWITVISHDRAVNENVGYVSSMNVGGKVISGNDFRTKVMEGKIRSHCFMLVYTPDGQ